MKNKVKVFGKQIPIVLIIGILIISFGTASIVNYLSNTATAEVNVDSPMDIQLAEVEHGSTPAETIDLVDAESVVWTDDLILSGIVGLDTVELGVKVENNADINIVDKYLEVVLSNDLDDVTCGDLTSLTFIDVGASPGTTWYQVVQELTGVGLCVEEGTAGIDRVAVYYIPINSLGAESTFKYPVTATFGVVAPTTYEFEATLLDSMP